MLSSIATVQVQPWYWYWYYTRLVWILYWYCAAAALVLCLYCTDIALVLHLYCAAPVLVLVVVLPWYYAGPMQALVLVPHRCCAGAAQQSWPKRPISARQRSNSARFGRCWASMVEFGSDSAEIGQCRQNPSNAWPSLGEFAQPSSMSVQLCPEIGRCPPESAQIRSKLANRAPITRNF